MRRRQGDARPVAPGIPRYALYGEPPREAGDRFVHVEMIADRSRPNDWHIRPHTHCDLHHLLLILKGGGRARTDVERFALDPPLLTLVPARIVHSFSFEPATHGYVITLCDALLRDVAVREPAFGNLFDKPRRLPLRDEEAREHELEAVTQRLLRELGLGALAQATAAEAHLQILLAAVVRLSGVAASPGTVQPAPTQYRAAKLVDAFRDLVEVHFRDNWQLADYAHALHISPAHLRSICVKVAGASPVQLIQDRTIRAAKRDLLYTRRSVGEIANVLGFDDPAYFSRFFHKHCGVSPSEFRLGMRQATAHNADTIG
jgi:AraC family transcriptional regulator, transcriptional activator of pobA